MVLVILAGIWAAVLVPPMLRSRAEARPADSIGSFRHQLGVLKRTGPGALAMADPAGYRAVRRSPGVPARPGLSARRARTLRRRRDVLVVLLGGIAATLVLGLAVASLRSLLLVNLLLDGAMVAYIALLVRARNAAAEREMKLRFLPASPPPDNVIAFRRSGT